MTISKTHTFKAEGWEKSVDVCRQRGDSDNVDNVYRTSFEEQMKSGLTSEKRKRHDREAREQRRKFGNQFVRTRAVPFVASLK